MSSRRTLAIIAFLAGFAVICWELRELGLLRHILIERAAQRVEIEGKIQALAKHEKTVRGVISASPLTIEKSRILPQNEVTKKSEPDATDAPRTYAIIAKSPALRRLYLNGFIANLSGMWGSFYRQLGLSPDQIDRFAVIQVQLENANVDIKALAANESVSMDEPGIAAQSRQAWNDAQQAVHALLGDPNYDTYVTYNKDSSARQLVTDLATRQSDPADQLTDQQSDQLTQILASASTRSSYGWVNYGTVNWQEAMPQAQTILTSAQYSALQTLRIQKTAQWQIAKLLKSP